ncbi:kinesin-like protein KIF23 [Prorops nasuta]|uniref:kinesin-like protein KIF23 n=1 Tax=Prorops nasuta TaxID=863751 RepID=UPI0034D00ACB
MRYSIMKTARSTPQICPKEQAFGSRHNVTPKDPVQVYCRLRPMSHPDDISCITIESSNAMIVIPPESAINLRNGNQRTLLASFDHLFGTDATQIQVFDVVALPLIQNLLKGKNSLLFTYGVTASGKTYTMTGDLQNQGIMPRCLNVIFNSILQYQAKRYVFKPDKMNGFDIQNEEDALLDRKKDLRWGTSKCKGKNINREYDKTESDTATSSVSSSSHSDALILTVDQDNAYAVFITYVEVYNNSVYDLLEETEIRPKTMQSKIIREDSNKNMYIHAVTEVEVKSSKEALQIFNYGQQRRRVAHTALNAESSRSHSVFTIRLVQAPLDSSGEKIVQDKRVIVISQISLVDLAGSERTNRSKNTGQRLREAGNINNSLMTLRKCLEILHENQTQSTNKLVPYRDSKLTHLFKNYFDGEGQVRMIVCVNPRADDYDETIQVIKFAEITQEVKVLRPVARRLDLGYTPGRRQANNNFREAQNRLEKNGYAEAMDLELDLNLVYSLGGPFPSLEVKSAHDEQTITTLMRFLEQRIIKQKSLSADLQKKQSELRNMLVVLERDNISLKIENATLKVSSEEQKRKINTLQTHVCKAETQVDILIQKLNAANDAIRFLQQEVKNKDVVLNQKMMEKERTKIKYNNKIQAKTEKMNKELEDKLKQQRENLEAKMKNKEEKLNLVKQIISSDDPVVVNENQAPVVDGKLSPSSNNLQQTESETVNDLVSIPIVNPRYRRSKSADIWLDHRPQHLVPLGTIFQPHMSSRKSVNQLLDPKDITDRTSRYCLVSQQDVNGELETKLYKGEILPTSSGGAQVVFNDMECLKQTSPIPKRKHSGQTPQKERQPSPETSGLSKKLRL